MVWSVGTDKGDGTTGDTVYIDGGRKSVQLEESVFPALSYTSAGLLVPTTAPPGRDNPIHLTLVAPDGTATQLQGDFPRLRYATDPAQPYVAYTEYTDRGVDVIVRDVSTDTEVARVYVEGPSAWQPDPPVIYLRGDTVLIDDGTRTDPVTGETQEGSGPGAFLAVNWRTGEVRPFERSLSHVFMIAGGRAVTGAAIVETDRFTDGATGEEVVLTSPTALEVTDLATGTSLLTVEGLEQPSAVLSPDGSHVMVASNAMEAAEFEVYDVDSGRHVAIDGEFRHYGWTASGDLYGVDPQGVHSCDVDTGACATAPLLASLDPATVQESLVGGWW
jgi:hypothetical protein